ncbi:LysR substrate-binding domain-containing protein [Pseudomonas typographi]|uniref:LysR substrate-binding domain-containing protein n=1 Tax=Pseudomonas typographi TaxID=2715964 RepID=UPI001688A1A6|nr:LysR substrate-binding domain-containing protein [Pseudomonas typographi]MBD1553083.1 LysR family transcriptional regulator [Pseudomonas typographi]
MLNSADIQFLLAIRKSASLLATAHTLGLTPSAVTQRLQQLEKKLGIQLIDRSARQLRFTDEGELLCRRGAGIIDQFDDLLEELHALRHGMVGKIAINAPFGFGRRYVASVVAAFRQRHPDVEIRMTLSDQPLVASSDRFDLVVHIGELRDSSLISHHIAPNRRMLCASPAFIQSHGLPGHPEDLAKLPTIALHENNEDVSLWQFRQRRTTVNIRTQPALISNDGDVIREWATEGLGIILRSEWDVAESLARGTLVQLLPDWKPPDANVVALTHQSAGLPERIRTFMRMMQEQFRPHCPWRLSKAERTQRD